MFAVNLGSWNGPNSDYRSFFMSHMSTCGFSLLLV